MINSSHHQLIFGMVFLTETHKPSRVTVYDVIVYLPQARQRQKGNVWNLRFVEVKRTAKRKKEKEDKVKRNIVSCRSTIHTKRVRLI